MNKILVGIGGEAGAGIMESGNLLAQYALACGYYTFVASEYPSLIRGGHNYSIIHINSEKINSVQSGIDILIALNQETIDLHLAELNVGSAIIYDSDTMKPNELQEYSLHGIPLSSIAKESGGPQIMRNTIAIGAAIGLLQGDFSVFQKMLEKTFSKKGDQIIKMNVDSALKGYRYAIGQHEKPFNHQLPKNTLNNNLAVISGNDAISIGAIRAGLKFAAIYPMTPVTGILDYLASKANDFGMVIKEPEDEISAIIMSIGAGYAGARNLTATSGGGFCLMTEGLGMAGIAEVPIVIIEGMRSGPSTAMATKTEQSDLDFMVNSGHGEFPRVIVAPGDARECLEVTFSAFNLADKYQLPVIIMTDKYLSSSLQVMEKPVTSDWKIERGKIATSGKNFSRYSFQADGVSPRHLPGTKGIFGHATSYEHDEDGHDNDEVKIRVPMMEKRMKKLVTLAEELPEPVLYGPQKADITIFGWGSNKGIILDSLELLKQKGIIANFLHIMYIAPFPAFEVAEHFDKAANTLIVENNYTGQMAKYITACTGRRFKNKLLKFDGTPFMPEEIVNKIADILTKKQKVQPKAGVTNE